MDIVGATTIQPTDADYVEAKKRVWGDERYKIRSYTQKCIHVIESYCMVEFVQFDPDVHLDDFRQLCIESFAWHWDQLLENYQVDMVPMFGTPQEYFVVQLESYITLKPPEGILYILEVDGEAAGMGAITKYSDDIGEIHRMYNRPQYRGRGYAQQLLDRLLEAGREFGYTTFRLATPKFAHAGQHIYRKAGFVDIEEYRDVSNPIARKYWICMEKKE